jgi:hypothetical protein
LFLKAELSPKERDLGGSVSGAFALTYPDYAHTFPKANAHILDGIPQRLLQGGNEFA